MSTIILPNYSSYSNYIKCGIILKSPKIDKKEYVLMCLRCKEVCVRYSAFQLHVQEHKGEPLTIWNTWMTTTEDEKIHGSNLSAETKNDANKEDFLMDPDPLEEQEVVLEKNFTQKNFNNSAIKNEPMETEEAKLFTDGPAEELVTDDDDDEDLNHKKSENYKKLKNHSAKEVDDDDLTDNNDNASVTDEDFSEDDDDDDKTKQSFAVKKSRIKLDDEEDIDSFMNNKTKVFAFIKAYQKQDELWDTTRPPRLVNRCKKKRLECCKSICKELAEDQIRLTTADVEKCIKYMRVRYIRDVRIRYNYKQNKDKEYKPLWFYDSLEFLRPTLRFVKEMEEDILLSKPQLEDEQMISFIKIYNKYRCLWNETDIFYNSEHKKKETLQLMLQEICTQMNINYALIDMQKQIDYIHKMVKKEKKKLIIYEKENKSQQGYESSCKFYEHIEYLLPHLGPFKCQYCPKIIYNHVYTFHIHTSKHNNSKPFQCPLCKKEFTQKHRYIVHLRRHTQDFPFICKYCCKGFPCKKELVLHSQSHPEYQKKFICDICGEGFTQEKLLECHIKVHNNIRDVICNICGKGFTNTRMLYQHRAVHSKEKSVCKLCSKSYSHYRGLSRHMAKEHGTTVAAVAAVMGIKPKNRVLTLDEIGH